MTSLGQERTFILSNESKSIKYRHATHRDRVCFRSQRMRIRWGLFHQNQPPKPTPLEDEAGAASVPPVASSQPGIPLSSPRSNCCRAAGDDWEQRWLFGLRDRILQNQLLAEGRRTI